jgi:putative FmdB family regulatory protein
MPTYQYVCTECGGELEAVQKFTDDPLTVHDDCGGRLRKVFSPVGIVFKGSGFYRTDSRSGSSASSSAASAGSSGADSSSSGDSGAKGDSGSTGDSGSKASEKADKPAKPASTASSSSGSSSGEKVA